MTQNVVGIRQPIITRRIAFFPSVRNPLLKNVRVRRRNSKKAEITLKKKIDRFYDNNLTTDGRITSNRLYIYKNSRDTFRSRVASSRFVNCVVPFIFFFEILRRRTTLKRFRNRYPDARAGFIVLVVNLRLALPALGIKHIRRQ